MKFTIDKYSSSGLGLTRFDSVFQMLSFFAGSSALCVQVRRQDYIHSWLQESEFNFTMRAIRFLVGIHQTRGRQDLDIRFFGDDAKWSHKIARILLKRGEVSESHSKWNSVWKAKKIFMYI